MYLNTYFQFLNNITRIFTYLFANTYFQKIENYCLNTNTKLSIVSQKNNKIY